MARCSCLVRVFRPDLEMWWKWLINSYSVDIYRGSLLCSGCLTMIISVERCVCVFLPLRATSLIRTRTMAVIVFTTIGTIQGICMIYPLKVRTLFLSCVFFSFLFCCFCFVVVVIRVGFRLQSLSVSLCLSLSLSLSLWSRDLPCPTRTHAFQSCGRFLSKNCANFNSHNCHAVQITLDASHVFVESGRCRTAKTSSLFFGCVKNEILYLFNVIT